MLDLLKSKYRCFIIHVSMHHPYPFDYIAYLWVVVQHGISIMFMLQVLRVGTCVYMYMYYLSLVVCIKILYLLYSMDHTVYWRCAYGAMVRIYRLCCFHNYTRILFFSYRFYGRKTATSWFRQSALIERPMYSIHCFYNIFLYEKKILWYVILLFVNANVIYCMRWSCQKPFYIRPRLVHVIIIMVGFCKLTSGHS